MLESIGTALPAILAITLFSVALVAWRGGEMAKGELGGSFSGQHSGRQVVP